MAGSSTPAGSPPLGAITRWLILILASIGFAFDIYELLMLPLVAPDALPDMGIRPGSPEFISWVQILFYVPAVFGGVFGLMGGYLTDWFGRRAVLTYSILLYAVSAFLSAYVTTPEQLLVLRCGVFVGVCVEFVAAVAWLAELFTDPRQRERALGYTQAFSSIGGLMVAIAYGISRDYGSTFSPVVVPEFLLGVFGIEQVPVPQQHAAWRYTLMSGLIPAIPLILIRPFLPESPVWQQRKRAGTLKRPSIKELFTTPALRTTTIVTTIMFACSYGAAFGTIQQMRNIVPALEQVQAEVNERVEGTIGEVKTGLAQLAGAGKDLAPLKLEGVQSPAVKGIVNGMLKEMKEKGVRPEAVNLEPVEQRVRTKITVDLAGEVNEKYTKVQEIGGLVGRFLLALLIVQVAGRRKVLRYFQVPGLIITPLVFYFFLTVPNQLLFEIPLGRWGVPVLHYLGDLPFTTVSVGVFLVALCTIAQFSFWGNYLPTVYPVHLRGTGESFAANVGGRLIGTFFAAVTLGLSAYIPPEWFPTFPQPVPESFPTFPIQMAVAAAIVGFAVYFVGFISSFFLPEPAGEDLPE